jgi:hypothetical protein
MKKIGSEVLSVRLGPDERLGLEAVAFDLGIGLSELTRRVIRHACDKVFDESPGRNEEIMRNYEEAKVRQIEGQIALLQAAQSVRYVPGER